MSVEHVDVLIVGAGLSGIGAGYHLQVDCPDKTYAILEARDCIGGTWDLFRYTGIRSNSDMYTLGYAFRPWAEATLPGIAPNYDVHRAPLSRGCDDRIEPFELDEPGEQRAQNKPNIVQTAVAARRRSRR